MKRYTFKATAAVLSLGLLLSGCVSDNSGSKRNKEDSDSKDADFVTSVDYEDIETVSFDQDSMSNEYNSYSFELMSQVLSRESNDTNVMVSPASVMFALDMCSAGANGDTLDQIINLFADGADAPAQHAFAAAMMERINSSQDIEFSCANAVWVNSARMSSGLNPDYEDYIEDYFDAEITAEDFDSNTVNEINEWVDDNTDGMIDRVLDELEQQTVSVLVNAIAFDGNWLDPYEEDQVRREDFTTSSGDVITVDMLNGTEELYYETDRATGFLKYYDGWQYALIVMLPVDESLSANEFLAGFTGDDFSEFINSGTYEYDVYTKIPEFDYDFDTNLNAVLSDLGVTDAFDEDLADFRGIGLPDSGGNIFIGKVIHKTHIELDRSGTRAAAATAVVMYDAACEAPAQFREVYCDRPFAYAIVDTESMNPIFIGTYNG